MSEMMEEQFYCDQCENPIDAESEFCPNCGIIFEGNNFCVNHTTEKAEGVCVICWEAFCKSCLEQVNGIYFCHNHASYEIYEGRARVFGIDDESFAEYVKGCLEQAGLHPVFLTLFGSPSSLGGLQANHLRVPLTLGGHSVNEMKIMVPFYEVIDAERIIAELNILDDDNEEFDTDSK